MPSESAALTSGLSLLKGGGAIKGIGETFQPNLFTGTGNFPIPIATSPGRQGFGPQLSLQYSTGNGNGIFGLGSVYSPNHAQDGKGLPKYNDDAADVFVMSGAEDLVAVLEKIDAPGGAKWQKPFPFDTPDGLYSVTRYRPRTEGLFDW